MSQRKVRLSSIEICAGAGGQALGLERAGFGHECLVEIDEAACETLRGNRPSWRVERQDICSFDASPYKGIDLLAGGLPCPPFSIAGKQLGADDERNLFPSMLRLVKECMPRAVMIENVRGILDPRFAAFRDDLVRQFSELGYQLQWSLLDAKDYGVSQSRHRVVFVALPEKELRNFSWPLPDFVLPTPVGHLLLDLMAERGWEKAITWAGEARDIAPTIVGGSKKHGGPDLGPTRSREAWLRLGVDGKGIADEAPPPGFNGLPRLTVRMVSRIQGFPDSWEFSGRKTAAYRQVGNAFPPPVANAVGTQIAQVLLRSSQMRAVAG